MACRTSRLVLILVLWAATVAVMLAVLGVADAATGSGSSAPGYCAVGQAIPRSPLPGCIWYVASRSCDVGVTSRLSVLKQICCHELEAVPAECRCRALRVMMEKALIVGDPDEQRRCRSAQDRFAPAVVSAAECGLPTVHGRPFCNALHDE